jgi:hypothetical protein
MHPSSSSMKKSMILADRECNLIVSAFYTGMFMRAIWVLGDDK